MYAGNDRDSAIERANEILEENDTVVFLSKRQGGFGENFITKEQLLLFRRADS